MSGLHVVSTLIVLVLLAGLASRGERRRHRMLMATAFVGDLGLVLYIEATRGAVEKVASGVPALLWFHVAVSVAVLACYAGMLGLGTKLFAGRTELRPWHRNLGITFVAFRTLNYVTSFLV